LGEGNFELKNDSFRFVPKEAGMSKWDEGMRDLLEHLYHELGNLARGDERNLMVKCTARGKIRR